MLIGILLLTAIAAALGALLVWAAMRLPPAASNDVERVNALLPQTQCGQCGHPGCRPYAEAIVEGRALLNQCPPGGEAVIRSLADLLGSTPLPLAPGLGTHRPPAVAVIDESTCIGCARCLDACPVDAIVGAHRYTHTVVSADCTGCELCMPVCPVDCIGLAPAGPATTGWESARFDMADERAR